MPRYFFDIHDGALRRDEVGVVCDSLGELRREAKRILPDLAGDEIPPGGDATAYTVLVRDDRELVIYTATLSFKGIWVYDTE